MHLLGRNPHYGFLKFRFCSVSSNATQSGNGEFRCVITVRRKSKRKQKYKYLFAHCIWAPNGQIIHSSVWSDFNGFNMKIQTGKFNYGQADHPYGG
jgi:hypothetical protein